MPQVFISYRANDEPFAAALIDRELSAHLGSYQVFRASKSIQPGDNFELALLRSVRASSVLLAVIGCRWLATMNSRVQPRLYDEPDWAHREIAEAMLHRVRVIPILVGNTDPPRATEIPADIAALATCQYLRLRYRDIAYDLARLIDELVTLLRR